MEAVAVALGVVNLVLLLLTHGMLVRSRGSGPTEASDVQVRQDLRTTATEIRQDLAAQRRELGDLVVRGQRDLGARLDASSAAQTDQWRQEREARLASDRAFRTEVDGKLTQLRTDNDATLERIRVVVDENLQGTLRESLETNARKIQELTTGNAEKHREIQKLLTEELDKLRSSNEAKLETMRATVDEKLQGTLEKRLGESFSLVSRRLEEVQKGLGEMQSLASDVGGLKRVLTNVKSRGTWGEVQLSRQLEDILAPDQYESNVEIRKGSQERVEFAVRLPGHEEGSPVHLPIDSKFPQEDYERLLQAQESGDREAVDAAGQALEKAVILQARTISSKYIAPPASTDFAILYLPTEGLFAEVISRPGLASRLQTQYRVMVTGPTTLMSLLNSLQMGFRSVAIEKRSSEVWQVLSAAKAEFAKYGQVWEKLGKQLQTAQKTVDEAGRRTRAVERRLREVETLEPAGHGVGDVAGALPAVGTGSTPGPGPVPSDAGVDTDEGVGVDGF